MKKTRTLSLACIVAASLLMASCGTSRSVAIAPTPASTTMECTQITGDGNYIIDVQGSGSNTEKATEDALKYAVKGMLFEGIPGSTVNRIQSQKPLVQDEGVRLAKQDYFKNFFDSGDYRLYVETLPNVFPKVVKVNGGYKVKVSVILKKNQLRHRLEKDGVIKALGASFR